MRLLFATVGISPFRTPIPSALVAYHCQLLGILFFFSGDWVQFLVLQTERSHHLGVCASGVRLVELAQQKSRVQLAKPKSFENLSHGVGSDWECLEIFYYHSIKVMVLGLVESVRSLLPDFLSLEFVQGGTIFLYHSCTQKNTRLRTGIGLRCVLPGDLKIKVASAQHIFTKGDCAGIPWGGNWSQTFVVVIRYNIFFASHKFQLLHYGIRMRCVYMLREPTAKGNNVGNGQEAARELISNTYLPHCRVF